MIELFFNITILILVLVAIDSLMSQNNDGFRVYLGTNKSPPKKKSLVYKSIAELEEYTFLSVIDTLLKRVLILIDLYTKLFWALADVKRELIIVKLK
ncbi:MAG: Unknown protein [uncultured Campylobacterales bacterium]|uniref:Uncharacterized protein n=1 Tax=uncultured Campylobacterales bacterium TaxID=352960 RepID=A0A6S6SAP5_9BACT|nr:MAG: Unknown protein [uncultured Campylobacterales bacterium]